MSRKNAKIAALIEGCRGRDLDARYLVFFKCFNEGQFYEAHDVLEDLWLADRGGPDGPFYKGLIQLAGAFVHLQKGRLRPAAALLKLAQANLDRYPDFHLRLPVRATLALIADWLGRLETGDPARNLLSAQTAPRLELREW